jgi:hypothetical protein
VGLGGIVETGMSEFVGGRVIQAALNVASGQAWDANLWNCRDIALDVLPGMAVAGWQTWRAVRAARQMDDLARGAWYADSVSPGRADDAARVWDDVILVDETGLVDAGARADLPAMGQVDEFGDVLAQYGDAEDILSPDVKAQIQDSLDDGINGSKSKSSTISFYHGTIEEHLESFRSQGVKAIGGGDFGLGFYTTQNPSEAVSWGVDRLGRGGQPGYVIELRIDESKFEALEKMSADPYFYDDTPETFIGLIRNPTGHPDLPYDYIHGPVSTKLDWEQFTFKSQKAIEALNASEMLIHRIRADGTLELVERIVR